MEWSPQVLWSRQGRSLLACLDSTFCFICNLFHWIIKAESPAESMNSNKHDRVGSLLQGWPKSTDVLFKMDFLPFFHWWIVPWTTQKRARLLEDTTSAPFNHGDILVAVINSFLPCNMWRLCLLTVVNWKCITWTFKSNRIHTRLNQIHSYVSVLFNFPVTNTDDPCRDIFVLSRFLAVVLCSQGLCEA